MWQKLIKESYVVKSVRAFYGNVAGIVKELAKESFLMRFFTKK